MVGTEGGAAPALLRVVLNDAEVCTVSRDEVPVERRAVAELRAPASVLHFVASDGTRRSYDLRSAYEEGDRFLHLSVRVGPGYTVQADALLGTDAGDPREAFEAGKSRGVRLQPFFLPERSDGAVDLAGRGLFARGLHFPGVVTPSNVSLLCICDRCAKSFRLQSFHARFGGVVYAYCSRAPHTLIVGEGYLPGDEAEAFARIEGALPPCEKCGGEFHYANPLRCPHCTAPFIDFARHRGERGREYYGNAMYGEPLQRWIPAG